MFVSKNVYHSYTERQLAQLPCKVNEYVIVFARKKGVLIGKRKMLKDLCTVWQQQ
jgi:hypothetical protein